jgi:chemotaxis protein CheX
MALTQELIVEAVTGSVMEVFTTMLNLEPVPQPPYREQAGSHNFDGIVALVGIAGDWTGSGRIYCSPKTACHMASAMLMTEYEGVNEDVLDAIAEIGNMVIGNSKNVLESVAGQMGLSVPTVIFGRNYQTRVGWVTDWVVVPFLLGEDKFEVRICLMPTKTTASSHRVELTHQI